MRGRLYRTTVFRSSLLYAVLFIIVAAAAMASIYWATAYRLRDQTDSRLQLEAELVLRQLRDQPVPLMAESLRRQNADPDRSRIFFYRLLEPSELRAVPELLEPLLGNPSATRFFADARLGQMMPATDGSGADPVRVLATRLTGGAVLLVGRDLVDQRELLDHSLQVALLAMGVIFVVAVTAGAAMGAGVLRRIDAVSRTAGSIIEGDLSRRIPSSGRGDEFDELALRLNAMLERIEALMAAMREVSGNVAHDLRGPLSRLRTRLELALLESQDPEPLRDAIEQAIEELDALVRLFNSLLSIAQAEAGAADQEWGNQDLSALGSEVAELYAAAAEDKGLVLETDIQSGVSARGNRQLLAQALSNLLDNAVKYTPSGGRIELAVKSLNGSAILTVGDTGVGIPEPDRQRVLERFVRLDQARSEPGNGLGLSLVRAVARAHGASLALESNQPGLRVRLTIPRPTT
jgi:signal transduction histidine kinase